MARSTITWIFVQCDFAVYLSESVKGRYTHNSSDLMAVLSHFNFSIPRLVLEQRDCIFLAEKSDVKRAEGCKFDVRMHLDQYFFDSVIIKVCTHEFSQGDSLILALDFDLGIGQNCCRDASRLNKLLNRGGARLRDYI